MKQFFEVRIKADLQKFSPDHIIAMLSNLGFDGFMEEEPYILAYRESAEGTGITDISRQMEQEGLLDVSINIIDDKNWNEAWESDYKMVRISDDILVRAPFHEAIPGIRHDIIIEPRMAFGTAHHETTSQMLSLISTLDVKGKQVLDMGCGTAVLAILAFQMGAKSILAVDNDEWAYRNSLDNVKLNGASSIRVKMGDATLLQNLRFDIIFANINRNILLEDIPAYASSLSKGGSLLMSGFYEVDLPVIREKALSSGLVMGKTSAENNWMAVEFMKQ